MIEQSELLIGREIILIETNDAYTTIKTGYKGIINYVDATGTVFAKWQDGSTLGLIPNEDKFLIFFD